MLKGAHGLSGPIHAQHTRKHTHMHTHIAKVEEQGLPNEKRLNKFKPGQRDLGSNSRLEVVRWKRSVSYEFYCDNNLLV